MIVIDRVTGQDRVRIARVSTFHEAALVVEEDRLLRNTVSVPVEEYDGTVYQRVYQEAPEGCVYEMNEEERV